MLMRTMYCVCLCVSICATTSVFADESKPKYVSPTWGKKWAVDKEATKKKKAELVKANPDKKPTSMRKQYMTYHEVELTQRDLALHVPMGPIGGFVRSRGQPKDATDPKSWHRVVTKKDHTWPELTVVNLIKNAPGDKGGLKVGDIVYGANGKAFSLIDWHPNAGRKGSFRELGLAIEDSEANRKGVIELMVRRGDKKKKVTVKIPPAGGFGRNFPMGCAKSMKYYDGICDRLVSLQKPNGSFGTGIMGSSVAALALLGHGDKKYDKAIEKAVDYLARKETMKAGCYAGFGTTWQIMYQNVFLCEYYLVTGDKRVLPVIKHLSDVACASMYNRMENKNGAYYGTFGHYINPDMNAQETVYKMSVITAGIAWSWALVSQTGIEVPKKNWDAITYHINRATGKNGGMGYCGPGDGSGSHPGVSNSMLALSCAVKDRRKDKDLKRLGAFLSDRNNFGAVMINHGVTMTPFYATSLALFRTDPKAYREYMDYWKWFITLTRGPDNHAVYWDMSGGGGDVKLGADPFMNGAMGIVLAAGKNRLFMYGSGVKQLPRIGPGGRTPYYASKTVAKRPAISSRFGKPRKARELPDVKAQKLEKALHKTLVALNARKPIKSKAMKISFFKDPVYFGSVDDGGVVFKSAKGRTSKTIPFDNLSDKDVAKLAAMAANATQSKDLYALTGVFYERLKSVRTADDYFQKAGKNSQQKFEAFFQQARSQ